MAAGYPERGFRSYVNYNAGSSVQNPYQRSDGGYNNLLKRPPTETERQTALYVRSVKQRTAQINSPLSPLSPNSSTSSISNVTIENQLQELERKLLLDEDGIDDDVSIEAMQQLISPSTSPSTSSSSSTSSSGISSSKQLLLETATVISENNMETAATNISVLKRTANPRGDPEQRLVSMMTYSLITRLNVNSPITELFSLEHQTSTQMLYDASPCFKMPLMAANFAILEAARSCGKIHIVDFDLGQGGQYVSLINSIAERSGHRFIKITAVCEPTFMFNGANTVNNLKVIGDKIVRLANRFGITVQFNVLNLRILEINRKALGCEPGEALAVNFTFILSRIADESVSVENPRDRLLRQVKSLEPDVVTLVEQEMNANTTPFMTRFNEVCKYYGSVLDSLDSSISRDNVDRIRVESCLTRKAANCVAREGMDRVERPEVLGKWRARMSMAGFKAVQFGPVVVEPVKSRFGSIKSNPGFSYSEEAGSIGFGWMGQVLNVMSAWH